MKTNHRKEDTHLKIKLGGLIKKAGLHEEKTSVIYGILLQAIEKLRSNDAEEHRLHWQIKGDIALTQEHKPD